MKGLLFLAVWLSFFNLVGQPVFFNHISQEDGLRNGNVRAIVKDYQGFIWIGTEDGLHRYDGYSMKVYRNQEYDSLSLSSNFILTLFEDSEKNLWIGTLDGGLCVYNRKHDNFTRIRLQTFAKDTRAIDAIRVILESSNKHLFIGSDGLMRAKVSAISMPFISNRFPCLLTQPTGGPSGYFL